jgi:hypothetical protein
VRAADLPGLPLEYVDEQRADRPALFSGGRAGERVAAAKRIMRVPW